MKAYLKMEMPPSCYYCPMTNDGFYLCKADNLYRELDDDCEERRPDWCPLFPIPEHGRLIDADAFTKGKTKYYILPVVVNGKVVIAAEEGET